MSWRLRILTILGVIVIVAGGVWLQIRRTPEIGHDMAGGLVTAADIGGPFKLTNQNGQPFGLGDLTGRYALIYFGYTFCPDVCPTELGKIAAAIDLLDNAGARVTPVLITIDPERDTVAVLRDYVPLFHERLVGLTGTPDEIRDAAKHYRVFYGKAGPEGSGDYLMDHSSFVYLIAPDGRVIAMFGYNHSADDIATVIRAHMNR